GMSAVSVVDIPAAAIVSGHWLGEFRCRHCRAYRHPAGQPHRTTATGRYSAAGLFLDRPPAASRRRVALPATAEATERPRPAAGDGIFLYIKAVCISFLIE